MPLTVLHFIIIALVLLASEAFAQDTPRMGGVLKVASVGEPPTLDISITTAVITAQIMGHVQEGLFTLDKGSNPIPLLAESHLIDGNGTRHTIRLRKGVLFHSGKEMTSSDVVASLKRWGRVASLGKVLSMNIDSIEASDAYTVVLNLGQPSSSLIFALAESHAVIYPKEATDAAGDGRMTDFTGTGPYRLLEHRPDRHIKLGRFARYVSRSEPPNGLGGRRTPYFEEIFFIPVPDAAVRLAGVETGDYHYGMLINQDAWERIRSLPQVEPRVVKPQAWAVAVLNHAKGLMANKKLRQAFQAALDMEPIMMAGFGQRMFYRLDPGIFFLEQPWHSIAGSRLYNQADTAKAARLLREGGYARQPLRWLTTKEYDFMYKNAAVARQQLERAGFVIDLQVLDWATLNSHALKADLWDIASTALVFGADPANHIALRCNWWGAWCLEEKELLLAELRRESDIKRRMLIVERIQTLFYEDVGRVKLGDFFTLDLARRELRGDSRTPRLTFWNSWLMP